MAVARLLVCVALAMAHEEAPDATLAALEARLDAHEKSLVELAAAAWPGARVTIGSPRSKRPSN